MTSKKHIFIITISFIISCYLLNSKEPPLSEIFYDAGGFPISEMVYNSDSTYHMIRYFTLSGDTITNIEHCIGYQGDYESFTHRFDSLYYAQEDRPLAHVNQFVVVSLLFDENMKIREIRFLKKGEYEISWYNYNLLVENILLEMEDGWINSNCSSSYYQIAARIRLK